MLNITKTAFTGGASALSRKRTSALMSACAISLVPAATRAMASSAPLAMSVATDSPAARKSPRAWASTIGAAVPSSGWSNVNRTGVVAGASVWPWTAPGAAPINITRPRQSVSRCRGLVRGRIDMTLRARWIGPLKRCRDIGSREPVFRHKSERQMTVGAGPRPFPRLFPGSFAYAAAGTRCRARRWFRQSRDVPSGRPGSSATPYGGVPTATTVVAMAAMVRRGSIRAATSSRGGG